MKNFNDYLRIIQEQTENISKEQIEQIAKELYAKVKGDGKVDWLSITRSQVSDSDNKELYGVEKLSPDEINEVLEMVDKMFGAKIFQ